MLYLGFAQSQVIYRATSAAKPFPKRPRGAKNISEPYFRFHWIDPLESYDLSEGQTSLLLKAKIQSDQELKKEYLRLIVNNNNGGSKANEIQLYKSNDSKEINFSTEIEISQLDRTINELILQVQMPNDNTFSSEPLKLSIADGQVKVIAELVETHGKSFSALDVLWLDPDPIILGDNPYVTKEFELDVRLRILCPAFDLDHEQVSFAINNILFPLSPGATLKGRDGRYTLKDRITLREDVEINKIQLFILDPLGNRFLSTPLMVNFSNNKPNLYLLSIGTKTNLNYTVKDAYDFKELYEQQGGVSGNRLFKQIQYDLLTEHSATATEIKGTIEELLIKHETGVLGESDLFILFISSHGFLEERTGEFRIQGDDFDSNRSLSTSVSYERDILDIINEIPCKKLIFIDACHSGRGSRSDISEIQKEIEKLNNKKEGLTVIVSSEGGEESYEDVRWRNGAFTEAILNGLGKGEADTNSNGLVTINELFDYISELVPKMVGDIKGKPQHPRMLNNELGNLSIYVVE